MPAPYYDGRMNHIVRNSNEVRWGVIGAGNVVERKSGMPLITLPGSRWIALMRRNQESARRIAARFEVPQVYDNADDLFANEEINAVYIATPPSTHAILALKALESGKNVYLEKPMAMTTSEAELIAEAVAASGKKLVMAHYRRALPAFIKIKKLLDSGAIGKVLFGRIQILQPETVNSSLITSTEDNWRLDPSVSGGGLFHDLAPHQLDLCLHWFGPARSSQGYSCRVGMGPADDYVTGSVQFESGVSIDGIWCFTVDSEEHSADEFVVYGSEGLIRFSFFGEKVILDVGNEVTVFDFAHPEWIQEPMIARTVRYFQDDGPNPCAAADGVETMKIIDTFTNLQN